MIDNNRLYNQKNNNYRVKLELITYQKWVIRHLIILL